MKGVYSSHIKSIGHDPDTNELHVTWDRSGKTSIYKNVPADLAHLVMNSKSVGEALNEHIKDDYDHRYL